MSKKVILSVLNEEIAKEAGKVSVTHNIPLIDGVVAATSKLSGCYQLLSDDSHLKKLPKRYVKVKSW